MSHVVSRALAVHDAADPLYRDHRLLPMRGRGASAALLALAVLLVSLSWLGSPVSAAHAAGAPDAIVFESRAPGEAGGGLSVGSTFPGHTFRLLERTQVNALTVRAQSWSPGSIFAAVYRLGTPDSIPDVQGDSALLGTTLITVDGPLGDYSGAISLALEPGWYAILTGTGRHGATAPAFATSLINTGTPTTPQSLGPYSINPATNARTFQGATTRFAVIGYALPPVPVPASRFLMQTAGPATWWEAASYPLTSSSFFGSRFEVTNTARVDRVGAWMRGGNGQVFAAIVRLNGASANPPPVGSPDFLARVVGSALIPVSGGPDEYSGSFGGLELVPGHYALVFGTGLFGASSDAGMMSVADQVIHPGSIWWTGIYWGSLSINYRMILEGIVPELAVAPDPVDFGDVLLDGSVERSVSVTNLRNGTLQLTGVGVQNVGALQFSLTGDTGCAVAALPAGASCTITLRYAPFVAGPHAGSLQVFSDGQPSPYEVALLGAGTFAVTPGAGPNGSIDPATVQSVAPGASASFSVSPDPGHHVAGIGGSCGGSLDGNVFTTDPVQAHCTVQASFALDPATALVLLGGDAQSAPVATAYAQPLRLRAENAAGLPVPGVEIVFDVPALGASVVIGGDAFTDGDGQVSVTATANTVAGPVQIGAHASGITQPLSFALTNVAAAPAQIAVLGGGGQSTLIGTAFADPVSVRVADAFGNPAADVLVLFEPPASGPGAILADASVSTDGDGIAATTATANLQAGTYALAIATLDGPTTTADLTNTAPVAALDLSITGFAGHAHYGEVVDYTIVLHNAGPDTARDVAIASTLSAQLDAEASSWICVTPASGCTTGGQGALADANLTIAAGESVTYVLTSVVHADAAGDSSRVEVTASHPFQATPASASASSLLVLFRDGFDAEAAGLPNSAAVRLEGETVVLLSLPTDAVHGARTVTPLLGGHAGDGRRIRLDRLRTGAFDGLRVVAIDLGGPSRTSPWVSARAGQPVELGLLQAGDGWRLVVEGSDPGTGVDLGTGSAPSYRLHHAADARIEP